jgi:hypothetical protein
MRGVCAPSNSVATLACAEAAARAQRCGAAVAITPEMLGT